MVAVRFWEVGLGWKLRFTGFPVVLRFHKNFKIFRRQKKLFFSSTKFFRTPFSRKNPTFFRNLKNIGIFKNKKIEIVWTRKFEFKKIWFFYSWKSQYFSDFEKMLDFFSKKVKISQKFFFNIFFNFEKKSFSFNFFFSVFSCNRRARIWSFIQNNELFLNLTSVNGKCPLKGAEILDIDTHSKKWTLKSATE